MKTMEKIVLLTIFVAACVLCTGTAYAAYYGVYDIRGGSGPEEYPLVEDFEWVDHTYTYSAGENLQFQIDFTLYAPSNWSEETYGVYREDTISNYNLYSYYYQVTNLSTSTEDLTKVEIPFAPAYVNWASNMDDVGGIETYAVFNNSSDLFTITFSHDLAPGESSDTVLMTSEYWWGWQPITLNGDTSATGTTYLSSLHDSPDGMIPAPNPEASTVALYIVGLIGMGTLYYRKKKMAEMEV